MNMPNQPKGNNQINIDKGNKESPEEVTEKEIEFLSPHMLMSLIFLIAYFGMLGFILYIESSDSINMKKGENSMMNELQILFGAITAGLGQVISYWFGSGKKK